MEQRGHLRVILGIMAWEASVICSIPLPPRPKPDRLFWNDTKTGIFTVKSAYHLQMRAQSAATEGECSSVGKDRKFWKFLWSMSIPPKVDRKSTRLNSSHLRTSRMPSSA